MGGGWEWLGRHEGTEARRHQKGRAARGGGDVEGSAGEKPLLFESRRNGVQKARDAGDRRASAWSLPACAGESGMMTRWTSKELRRSGWSNCSA